MTDKPGRNAHEGPTAGRIAAFDIMRAVREGELADRALDRATQQLDARDRAWTQELAYGTLRLRARLDHIIATHTKRPLSETDPDVLDILRLGCYQVTEMSGVPPYAAVSQSVELAKRAHAWAGGFVNGVLQSIRRNPGGAQFVSLDTDPAGHLTTWGSHPRWLVERWVARFGAAEARALVDANNSRPNLFVRPLSGDVNGLLADAGIEFERVPFANTSLRITSGSVADVLASAPVIVQDPAASLVATYADDGSPLVLDLAAAPGGKAIALATAEGRYVVAADISAQRMERLRENTRRLSHQLGSFPVGIVVSDARRASFRAAPLVLLDAPCTGTGTLRRHPDGRWRVRPEDLASLVKLQAGLLDAAASLVQPGGLLAYATCSLEPEENELQVASFLQRHPEFVAERSPRVDSTLVDANGFLCVLPHVHGVDGAFCALLRKV